MKKDIKYSYCKKCRCSTCGVGRYMTFGCEECCHKRNKKNMLCHECMNDIEKKCLVCEKCGLREKYEIEKPKTTIIYTELGSCSGCGEDHDPSDECWEEKEYGRDYGNSFTPWD